MTNPSILLNQDLEGSIKQDVLFEDETVWFIPINGAEK